MQKKYKLQARVSDKVSLTDGSFLAFLGFSRLWRCFEGPGKSRFWASSDLSEVRLEEHSPQDFFVIQKKHVFFGSKNQKLEARRPDNSII